MRGWASASEPSPTKSCGTFCALRYGLIARLLFVPTELKIGEHLVLLDELSRQLHRLGRVVPVVEVAVVDLAAVDAALRVDVGEVRLGARADRAERSRLAGERHGAAEDDRRRRDAGIGAGRRTRRRREEQGDRACENAALHREIGLASVGSERPIAPTVTFGLGPSGRSR